MTRLSQKAAGAYYTPEAVAGSLVSWALRSPSDRLLDPSCGDGQFIALHTKSVGIEQDSQATQAASARAPWALVHEGDFFTWARETEERFECAAGNPPFIRYQTFKGAMRDRALSLCAQLGAQFTGLASSWAPFLVAASSLLKPGGRMAFVVPAEIGHAPYAGPVLEHLVQRFSSVQIIAVRAKLFPDLSEDCWLLYAEGYGGRTDALDFTVLDRFKPTKRPPPRGERIPIAVWRQTWGRRLRPFLISREARLLYQAVAEAPASQRFRDLATIGIGYVSGANDFFHLRPSEARRLRIPNHVLHPTVRNARALPDGDLTAAVVAGWREADDPMLLLRLQRGDEVSSSVRNYLESSAGKAARESYKCRNRSPWYAVPDVQVPDLILTYMSGRSASLVRNGAGCTCTNSVHSVRLRTKTHAAKILKAWEQSFTQLSCELEGHALGGGMLKLEPREAGRVLFAPARGGPELDPGLIGEALTTLRSWRHYAH